MWQEVMRGDSAMRVMELAEHLAPLPQDDPVNYPSAALGFMMLGGIVFAIIWSIRAANRWQLRQRERYQEFKADWKWKFAAIMRGATGSMPAGSYRKDTSQRARQLDPLETLMSSLDMPVGEGGNDDLDLHFPSDFNEPSSIGVDTEDGSFFDDFGMDDLGGDDGD